VRINRGGGARGDAHGIEVAVVCKAVVPVVILIREAAAQPAQFETIGGGQRTNVVPAKRSSDAFD